MITSNEKNTCKSNLMSFAWVLILICLVYFIVREFLQFALSPKFYSTDYENILDVSIIFFSGYILISSEWQETLVVITIILSWTELILLTGRHPKLSTNIQMLKTVSLNYFLFLLSYFLLLIAFAFSFYSFNLLHKNATNSRAKYNDTKDQYFFMNPYMSVMATFVMMMGEFQTESLAPEMANSPAYFCLFALFVFVIAMVLLNLLTGLAVHDTQKIKSKAKQLSRASRIRIVYELESILLQWYTFVGKWPKYTLLCPLISFQKSKIKIISLFQDPSHKKKLHVLPNKGPNNVFWHNGLSECKDGDELESGHATHGCVRRWARHIQNCLNKSNKQDISYDKTLVIIEEATRIISKRSKPDVNNMKENFGQIQET